MTSYPEPPRKENIPATGSEENALADLAYLWKCDDPEWMNQRETDWQELVVTAFDDYPKSEKKALERYFKYGEKSGYIPVGDFFLLTPYDSKESLLQLFNSSLLTDNDRSSMFSAFIFRDPRFERCHWFEHHARLIVEVILGDKYFEVFEQSTPSHSKVISSEPTLWCNKFVRFAIKSIQTQVEWKPFYQCISYFISALPYAVDERDRKGIKLPKLLQLVTESLEEGELSGRLLTFAQELKDREQEILQAWEIGEQKIAAMKQEP